LPAGRGREQFAGVNRLRGREQCRRGLKLDDHAALRHGDNSRFDAYACDTGKNSV
jgi:hypothetical protein